MNKIRRLHFASLLGSFGKNSRLYGRVTVYYPENIFIGENTTLNEGVILNARDNLFIGNDVHISAYVIINAGALDYIKKGTERQHISSPVIIEEGVWVASGAIINPGVTIGSNSVIGAGAVVTKDIPPNSVAVGVPAKVIKQI